MESYYHKYFKNSNLVSYQVQIDKLEKEFPDGVKKETFNKVSFTFNLSPDTLGRLYEIKLEYNKNTHIVSVYITKPKPLPLAEGETKYPHMYSQEEQKLCLYYPIAKEFESRKMCWIKTIIAWTKEWLFFYETWVITGIWEGEGIEHGECDAPDIL